MKQPHKHAEVLRAIADGIDVQWRADDWVDYGSVGYIHPNPITSSIIEWRIKPEPKPDVVAYTKVELNNPRAISPDKICWQIQDCHGSNYSTWFSMGDNLKLTFDGETGELKSAEVIK